MCSVQLQDKCKFRELGFVPEFAYIPKRAWLQARSKIESRLIPSGNLFRAMLLDEDLLGFLEEKGLVVSTDFYGNAEIVRKVWKKALVAVAVCDIQIDSQLTCM